MTTIWRAHTPRKTASVRQPPVCGHDGTPCGTFCSRCAVMLMSRFTMFSPSRSSFSTCEQKRESGQRTEHSRLVRKRTVLLTMRPVVHSITFLINTDLNAAIWVSKL